MATVINSLDKRLLKHYHSLSQGNFQIISQHRRVMNLMSQDGVLFSMVNRYIAHGPRQIRVDGELNANVVFPSIPLSSFDCSLCPPKAYDPEPAIEQAWFRLAQYKNVTNDIFSQTLQHHLETGIAALLTALDNQQPPKPESLLGLGQGLTPDGDDFLCGLLISSALPISPFITQRAELVTAIRQKIDRTNLISAAFLEDACQQQVAAPIQAFINSLANPPLAATAIDDVLSIGHRSGSSLLSGLLAGLPHLNTRRKQLCPYIVA